MEHGHGVGLGNGRGAGGGWPGSIAENALMAARSVCAGAGQQRSSDGTAGAVPPDSTLDRAANEPFVTHATSEGARSSVDARAG